MYNIFFCLFEVVRSLKFGYDPNVTKKLQETPSHVNAITSENEPSSMWRQLLLISLYFMSSFSQQYLCPLV